ISATGIYDPGSARFVQHVRRSEPGARRPRSGVACVCHTVRAALPEPRASPGIPCPQGLQHEFVDLRSRRQADSGHHLHHGKPENVAACPVQRNGFGIWCRRRIVEGLRWWRKQGRRRRQEEELKLTVSRLKVAVDLVYWDPRCGVRILALQFHLRARGLFWSENFRPPDASMAPGSRWWSTALGFPEMSQQRCTPISKISCCAMTRGFAARTCIPTRLSPARSRVMRSPRRRAHSSPRSRSTRISLHLRNTWSV